VPTNLHTALLDGVVKVEAEDAREMARRAAREEGMLVGISSGATLAAIAQKLPELPAGSRVLGFNYDTGERYLSTEGFLPTGALRCDGWRAIADAGAAADDRRCVLPMRCFSRRACTGVTRLPPGRSEARGSGPRRARSRRRGRP
jgi:cysteine synthase A